MQTCVAGVGACLSFLSVLCKGLAHGCLCAAHRFQLCTFPEAGTLRDPSASASRLLHPLHP